MPLTREQRTLIAHALRWARNNGWKIGAWSNTWHNNTHWVAFDTGTTTLLVDVIHPIDPAGQPLPHRLRHAKVHATSPEQALDVLVALGLLHPALSPLVNRYLEESIEPVTGQPDPYADGFDGPASFTAAGEALADLVFGQISAGRAAEALSGLARSGLIISTEYHEQATAELANDPRLGEAPDLADLAMVLSSGEYVPLDRDQP